jgi:hypothetical protein
MYEHIRTALKAKPGLLTKQTDLDGLRLFRALQIPESEIGAEDKNT